MPILRGTPRRDIISIRVLRERGRRVKSVIERMQEEFLSASSAREDDTWMENARRIREDFYPRPPRERTTGAGLPAGHAPEYFYPRPPRERTTELLAVVLSYFVFLSASSAREDDIIVASINYFYIFLSASSAREDDLGGGIPMTRKTHFYPRPPRERTTAGQRRARNRSRDFYPRPPRERTTANMTRNTRRFPSIFVA